MARRAAGPNRERLSRKITRRSQSAQKHLSPVEDGRWNMEVASSEIMPLIARLRSLRSSATLLQPNGPQVLSAAVDVATAYREELQLVGEQIYGQSRAGGAPSASELAQRCVHAVACEQTLVRAIQSGRGTVVAPQGDPEGAGQHRDSPLANICSTLFSPLSCSTGIG